MKEINLNFQVNRNKNYININLKRPVYLRKYFSTYKPRKNRMRRSSN